MKAVIWVVGAIVALGGGYYLYKGQQSADMPTAEIASVPEAGTPDTGKSAKKFEDSLKSALKEITDKAEDTVDEAKIAAESVKQSAEKALDETTQSAKVAAEAASEAIEAAKDEASASASDALAAVGESANKAASDAAAVASQAASDATETMSGAADKAASSLTDWLTVEGFDYEKVVEMIDTSEMAETVKSAFKEGLDKARNSPEMLQNVLDQIKSALNV